MAYVTQEQLRAILKRKIGSDKQVDFARKVKVKPQNLSLMLKGAPIGGKLLTYLGYERVDDLYRPVRKAG